MSESVFVIDSSALRVQCARRLAREQSASQKLSMIARLQRRYIECRLPKESESRVEQSFNEQLFAKVFGYRTLLSHEQLPYHLRPKNYAGVVAHQEAGEADRAAAGVRRFDDFSLGIFWGDERDRVVATAEFKDPGTDLDAPQTDRKERITPVEQAFRTAKGFPACRWVIVSNFRHLRLYRVEQPNASLVTLDLHEIRTPKQLATLAAYFDYEALIGTGGKPGMVAALDSKHPSMPIGAADNTFRVVCTFTPLAATAFDLLPLSSVYDAVRGAAVDLLKVKQDHWDNSPLVPTNIDDGWVSVETEKLRLAMSGEGQVRCSIRHPRLCGPAQINPDAGFWSIAKDLHHFLVIVERLYGAIQGTRPGILSFELREVRGWQLHFEGQDLLKKNDNTNIGIADNDEVLSGDVLWSVGEKSARVAADCMGELALQFKSAQGSRVRFDHAALAVHFDGETRRVLSGILEEIAETGRFPGEHRIRTRFGADHAVIDRLLEEKLIARALVDVLVLTVNGLRRMRSDPRAGRELHVCATLIQRLQAAYSEDSSAIVDLGQLAGQLGEEDATFDTDELRRAALVLLCMRDAGIVVKFADGENGLPATVSMALGILKLSAADILGADR